MKRAVILSLLLLLGCLCATAQSAYEQMMQIAGYANLNVPPPSEPVCAICRIPLRGARDWDHQPWCDYYYPQPSAVPQQPVVESEDEEEETPKQSRYSQAVDPDRYEVYAPPTPIRDTPEGKAILDAIDQLGDAVQSLISAGLREVMSWGFDKIYQTTHKEYHSSDPAKGWGNIQVVGKGGKEGVWDNVTHKWYVRPGKYDEFLIVDPYNCAARKEGKWGLIEATDKGRELVPCQYDEVLYYTRYGVGAPIAFGVKDQGGNMHWMIGLVNLEDGKYQFTPFRGEWCSVDFTYKPSPKDGEPMVAILAKDAKTGYSQVLDYFGKPIFGYRSDEQYDNVFLTGMVEKGKSGDQEVWYDFYRVEKGGKTGFVFHEVTADYKRFINSFELLPCEYDEISPLGNVIGWKEAKRWNSGVMGYNGKNLIIAQKNGRYGVGTTTHIKSIEGDLPFTEVSVMKIPFHGEEKLPVVIGKEPDGRYVAMHPDGSELYGWGVKRFNQAGEGVLEYGSVNGYVLKDVIAAIEENLRLNPRKWNLTDEEVKILKGK